MEELYGISKSFLINFGNKQPQNLFNIDERFEKMVSKIKEIIMIFDEILSGNNSALDFYKNHEHLKNYFSVLTYPDFYEVFEHYDECFHAFIVHCSNLILSSAVLYERMLKNK